jgi:hypothetical protein
MYSLVVLGLIPGTNIQITFRSWSALAGWVAGCVLVYSYRHLLTPEAVALRREVVHASQFHHRG